MPETTTVTLAIAPASWTCESFDPSIEGVDPITKEGTPVCASFEKAVRAAAKEHAISLRRKV